MTTHVEFRFRNGDRLKMELSNKTWSQFAEAFWEDDGGIGFVRIRDQTGYNTIIQFQEVQLILVDPPREEPAS